MTARRSPSTVAALRRGVEAATPASEPVPAAPDPDPVPAAKVPAWDARISLTATAEMKRALDLARVEDGIEATARIRAMITLWQEDPRLRARVDKLAKTLR